MEQVTNIAIEHIHPHPDNPRKDLGDLSELVESIKKNGILQNLTVVPIDGQPGEYMSIIGHRRCGAAELAGMKEVPCKIVQGMTKKEQFATMMEENMQRNDLTIFEQAQGFQMMLDHITERQRDRLNGCTLDEFIEEITHGNKKMLDAVDLRTGKRLIVSDNKEDWIDGVDHAPWIDYYDAFNKMIKEEE